MRDYDSFVKPRVRECVSRLVEARQKSFPLAWASVVLALLRYIDNDEIRREVERAMPGLSLVEDR